MALPNVNVNVGEQTLVAANTRIPFIPAVLLKTKSGPIGTIETITSESQFKAIFGESDYTTPAAYALQVYLRSYSYVLVTRISNDTAALKGTGTLSFVSEDSTVNLITFETKYKTDMFNGKEIKLVYDGEAHKLWLDISALTGKTTISIKENFIADTATAVDLETALDKLVTSINSMNYGINLTNVFVDKTASDPVPTVDEYEEGFSSYVSGGDSGNTTSIDTSTIKGYISSFTTPDRGIDVMLIPEYTAPDIINYATGLALDNNFMVITSPIANSVQEAITAVTNYDTTNRGSLAIYFPDVYYNGFIDNLGELQAIPACMAVLHTYAKTDIASKWGAPAGVTRGNLTLVNSMKVQLSLEDLTLLYDNTIPINGINNISGKGYIVWGNKTATQSTTFFDRINVSRLVKYVTKQAYLISWDYLFEPITLELFDSWKARITSLLDNIKVGNGIDAYQVIMDGSINTPETVAANQLNGIIKIKPQEVAEFITLDFTITDTIDVSIEE